MDSILVQKRLVSQQLVQPVFDRPADLVAWFGAMQAQDFAGAKWAVGLRVPTATESTIEQAIADKSIIRTWALRINFFMPNRTTTFLAIISISLMAATATVGQACISIAPTISAGYRTLDFALQSSDGTTATGTESTNGLSMGLTAYYAVAAKWSLSAGLLHNWFTGNYHFDNATGTATQVRRYDNFQVPVLLNYTSSAHRLSPYLSAGLLTNYNYRTKITRAYGIFESHQQLDEPNALSVYGMIGVGMQYRIGSKLALILQPTAAYCLNKPTEYPVGYSRFNDYLLGVQAQLKITF